MLPFAFTQICKYISILLYAYIIDLRITSCIKTRRFNKNLDILDNYPRMMQKHYLFFFANRHIPITEFLEFGTRDSADSAASPDSSKSLGLGPLGLEYDAGPDAPRPSSHARRQGLGSPRAIGTHMRRPRLRKCSLSLLFCPFISLDSWSPLTLSLADPRFLSIPPQNRESRRDVCKISQICATV